MVLRIRGFLILPGAPYVYCSLSVRRSQLIPWSDLPRIAIRRWRWHRCRTNRQMWISSMRICDGPIWTAMAGLVAMKPSLSSRALVTQTGPCSVQIDRMTTHHAALSLMERFREGRPLPAVLPSNVMFAKSNIFEPANNYSNAGNVAWRPASGFQQQQLMPGLGARHMAPLAGGRPPKTVAPSHAEEKQRRLTQSNRIGETSCRSTEYRGG